MENNEAIEKSAWSKMDNVAKANWALGDLSSGGLLPTDVAQEFLIVPIKESKLLGMATTKPIKNPEFDIPNLKWTGVLKGGKTGTPLGVGDRSKPTTGNATLVPKLFKGEARVDDEVFEDNVEREGLKNTILAALGKAIAADMENVAINGDTSSSDSLLKVIDGWLKKATSHVVAAGGTSLNSNALRDTMKALPPEFRGQSLAYYTYPDAEVDYRDALGQRATVGGDAWMVENAPNVAKSGVKIIPIPLFPSTLGTGNNETVVLLAEGKNMWVGIRTDVQIEPFRDPTAAQTVFAIRLRFDVNFAYEPAVAKATGITLN